MKRNIVVKSPYPSGTPLIELASFHIQAVPATIAALVLKSQKYFWASPDDWHRGRKSLAYLGAELLMPSGIDIVNAIDRVYTLVDSGLNGRVRSVEGEGTNLDPFIYTPPLEQAAAPEDFDAPGLRNDTYTVRLLLDNLTNGTVSSASSDDRNFRQQLEDLILAVGAGDDLDPEILAKLGEIAILLA